MNSTTSAIKPSCNIGRPLSERPPASRPDRGLRRRSERPILNMIYARHNPYKINVNNRHRCPLSWDERTLYERLTTSEFDP
jgi:hypothetical protein